MTAVVDAEARHCKSGIHLKADSIKESICTRGRSHLSARAALMVLMTIKATVVCKTLCMTGFTCFDALRQKTFYCRYPLRFLATAARF